MPVFDINDPAFHDWLHKKVAGATTRAVRSAAIRTLGAIQNEIIPAEDPQPVDQGAYRSGWQYDPTEEGADLYNTLPYAAVIEGGARAENIKIGRKMIDALTEWVQRKQFGAYGMKTATGRIKIVKLDANAVRSIAWAIATSMMKRGIFNRNGQNGLRIAEKAVERFKQYLPQELARELKKGGG